MNIEEIRTNLVEVEELIATHATESNEVIAAHSILPILRNLLLYVQEFETVEEEIVEEDDEEDGQQVVWINVSLYARLIHYLWGVVANEEAREFAPEMYRDAISLAAGLQGQIERRSPSEILLELVPDLANPELQQDDLDLEADVDTEETDAPNETMSEGDDSTVDGVQP